MPNFVKDVINIAFAVCTNRYWLARSPSHWHFMLLTWY